MCWQNLRVTPFLSSLHGLNEKIAYSNTILQSDQGRLWFHAGKELMGIDTVKLGYWGSGGGVLLWVYK